MKPAKLTAKQKLVELIRVAEDEALDRQQELLREELQRDAEDEADALEQRLSNIGVLK